VAPDLKPDRRSDMRFMVMVKATKDSEAGKMPSEELLLAMAKFNEEMVKAGVMLDGNGLQPSSKGARVRFSGPDHVAKMKRLNLLVGRFKRHG
jgi:hypothetical protein